MSKCTKSIYRTNGRHCRLFLKLMRAPWNFWPMCLYMYMYIYIVLDEIICFCYYLFCMWYVSIFHSKVHLILDKKRNASSSTNQNNKKNSKKKTKEKSICRLSFCCSYCGLWVWTCIIDCIHTTADTHFFRYPKHLTNIWFRYQWPTVQIY